ncbi:MAG: NosD domain-containing protein [Conexivisphaerales archaeon]
MTGNELIQSESIVLNGNLTVQSGGNLSLENVVLTINSQYSGQNGILVQPGGSLYIYNSDITAGNSANRYTFVVNGNNFVIENSQVYGVGSCGSAQASNNLFNCLPRGEENHQFTVITAGMVVETDNALIENNLFSQNAIGLIVGGSSVTVKGNTFQSNDYSALGLIDSSNDLITDNTFEQNPANLQLWIAYLGNANNSLIEYNTLLTENLPAVPTQANPASWTEGFGPQSRCDGLFLDSSYSNIITHNNITAQNVAVALEGSDNNTVSDNILAGGEDGINTGGHAVDSTIESNTITAYGTAAITLMLAHGSVVANNSISTVAALGIQIDHTSNSTILNNNITMNQVGDVVLYLSSSNNDVVAGNDLSGALQGILIYDSSDNGTIYDNQVSASYSIAIEGSSLNRIYQNDFHDLSPPVGGPSDNGNNSWSLGKIGNYWSYYTPANLNSCAYNSPSCFVGSATYNRTSIPPNGTEFYSEQTPFTIYQVPITQPQFVTFPITSEPAVVPGNVIVNQVVQMNSGHLPSTQGNLTIVNSTLILGSEGQVSLGGPNLTIDIENSEILDAGYGSGIGLGVPETSPTSSLVIINSTLDGVSLQDLDAINITVENSIISDSQQGYGITIANADYVNIVNNTFSYDFAGIRTSGSEENSGSVIISGNTVLYPVGSGIVVNVGQASNPYTLVSGNIVTGAWNGGIAVSVNATIAGNIISDSRSPIQVSNSFDSLIVNNTISNSFTGIWFSQCGSDLVYHNNFINDSVFPGYLPVQSFGGFPNTWDYNGQGNYWSSYNGTDANLDGIGDTPFVIPGVVQDNDPIMQPNGWLTMFYLTLQTNLSTSTTFQINGTSFSIGQSGSVKLPLGYIANYSISFAQDVPVSEGIRLGFLQWSDGTPSASRILSLSANSTVQVSYMNQYQLTLGISPSGKGSTEPSGSSWINEYTVVNITATPAPGCNFTGWSGDATGTANPTQVTMDGPKSITANFQGTPGPESPWVLASFVILIAVLLAVVVVVRHRRQQSPVRT